MATSTAPVARTGKVGSTIFLKTVMAVTGLFFALFVLMHMYGNLKLFAGRTAYNQYAEHLRTFGEPILPRHGLLTILEVLLVVAVIAHIYSAAQLWKRSNAARPVKYKVKKSFQQSFSSKWMRWGGLFLILFIIWHLLQFTLPKINVSSKTVPGHDPFALVTASFGVWWLTLIYLVAMFALGMHLNHGVWSACQTLGFTNTVSAQRTAKIVAGVVALVVAVGFILPPLFILFGVIK